MASRSERCQRGPKFNTRSNPFLFMSSARDEGIMVNMRLRCLICTNTPEYEPLRALFRQKAMFLFPSLFMKSYVSLISIYYFNSLFVSKRTKKNHIRLWLLVLWETRLKTTTQVIPPVFCFYSFFQTIFSWLFWNNLLSSNPYYVAWLHDFSD